MAFTTAQEFLRVTRMLSGLTVTVPMTLMTGGRIDEIEKHATTNATLAALDEVLRKKLKAVTRPEDYTQMGQAYEAYAEASFWLAMADRGVNLERTPGTGQLSQKRPDFVHHHKAGDIYFEVKALGEAESHLLVVPQARETLPDGFLQQALRRSILHEIGNHRHDRMAETAENLQGIRVLPID